MDPPTPQAAKQFMSQDIENSFTEPHADIQLWPQKGSNKHPT